MASSSDNIDEAIRGYFASGYTNEEMKLLLTCEEGISISCRQLRRRMQRLGLKRRIDWSPGVIESALQTELQGSGTNLSCRAMANRLRMRYGMSVGRNRVLEYLRQLDPEGIQNRRRHRLTRREYHNKGPNFLIHVDGYDKIKRFGFAIHGAMCGYSRRVLWLKVSSTNNDPRVIASYYLDYVKEIQGVPRCIRMDAGTENGLLANIQKSCRWFHEDDTCGEKSVIIGSSHSNQRIESWWRQLHQMCIASWKEKFIQMDMNGLFSTADSNHIDCLRFCFMKLIQEELDHVRLEWNSHQMRRQTRVDTPYGKPDIMFANPELFGAIDHQFPVNLEDCRCFQEFCTVPSTTGVDEMMETLLMRRMTLCGKTIPETTDEAMDLLPWLINQLH